MNWTFVKVKRAPTDRCRELDYGWMLKVSDAWQLFVYHQNLVTPRFNKVKKLIDYEKPHWQDNGLVQIVAMRSIKEQLGVVDALGAHVADMFECQMKLIEESGAIYISEEDGYFPKDKRCIEYGDPAVSESMVFPQHHNLTEDDIEVKRWRGGKHYYAKIKSIDVVVNNEQKWGTYAEALGHAKTFLKDMSKE